MLGGVKPEPSRLEKVLQVIDEQNADIVGLQETKVTNEKENELVWALRTAGKYHYGAVFDADAASWVQDTGAVLFSRIKPSVSRCLGECVKAVEMVFPSSVGDVSISNVYLSHISEAARLTQIREVLEATKGNPYRVLVGDFNALSPEDGIPQSVVETFSGRMKEKYCRDGKLCYDTIEAVLNEGFIDVGLRYHQPQEITGKTDLSGSTTGGGHTRGIRMDFIFAKPEVLPYVKEFALVRKGLARTASDHFPWYVILNETLFQKDTV